MSCPGAGAPMKHGVAVLSSTVLPSFRWGSSPSVVGSLRCVEAFGMLLWSCEGRWVLHASMREPRPDLLLAVIPVASTTWPSAEAGC